MTAVSVLVADRQQLFAEALAAALSAADDSFAACAGQPRSPDELLVAVECSQPDVVLADAALATADGVLAALNTRAPAVKLIALSWRDETGGIEQVLAAGAVGWLPKTCEIAEIAAAVRQAHAGESPVLCGRLQQLCEEIRQERVAAEWLAQRLAGLTDRERDVVQWLAAGCTSREIAEQLGTTPHTVQTHIRNLKRKTGARTQLEVARLAWRHAAAPHP